MLVHLAEAPINIKNFYGETPLHLAVEGGFTDIIEVKIQKIIIMFPSDII